MSSEPTRETPDARLRSRLTGFLSFLGREGFPVGTGAEVDLGRSVDAIEMLSRSAFRSACGATLAKSPDDLRWVEAAFDRYFSARENAASLPDPDVAMLRPALRAPPPRGGRDDRGGGDEPPPVVVPLGTYSAHAPTAAHPLVPLSEREVRRIRHGVRRFRRASATLPGRRVDRSHRGAVDLRDTVRQSLRHGGEWVELGRRRPRPSRAEFVVLWDVSGSMREHESRFFALVHALEALSRRSRVFAFSTRIQEITAEVRRYGYPRATAAIAQRIGRADGGTRIGSSLHDFAERFGYVLGPSTTLVVLSDGWDLGEAEWVSAELARLRRRVRGVVWVTPYTHRPGFRPEVGALRAARASIDQLLGPEDFESRWPLRPFRG